MAEGCRFRREPRRGEVHSAWAHDPDGWDGDSEYVSLLFSLSFYNAKVNIFYDDETKLAADLVTCINQELRGLAEAGCTHVQIDEPVMMR